VKKIKVIKTIKNSRQLDSFSIHHDGETAGDAKAFDDDERAMSSLLHNNE
jgi:hypothetical protein